MQRILWIGKGGDGVQFAAKLFAQTAINHGYYVTLVPQYGPEARGAQSKVIMCIDRVEVSEPIPQDYDILMVFNLEDFKEAYEAGTHKQSFCFPGKSNIVYVRELLKYYEIKPENAVSVLEGMSKRNFEDNKKILLEK